MGLFNLIETFFYLSLGVCFVLIILLVYHFKQRILSLEKKSDTMVDIISNVVKEVSNLKSSTTTAVRPPTMFEFFEDQNHAASHVPPFPEMSFFMSQQPTNPSSSSLVVEELQPEEEEEDDEDDEEDTDEDVEEDTDADDEEEDADEDADEEEDIEDVEVVEEKKEEQLDEREPAVETYTELPEALQEISLSTSSSENKDDESTIRIVNIPLNQTIQNETFDLAEDIETETDADETVELRETEPILVNKLDETVLPDVPEPSASSSMEEPNVSNEKMEKQESYRKMNVQQLRALVISNGLSTNTSKLNKTELIKLLESMDE